MNREELIAELLHAAHVLKDGGYLPATDGNFSARLDQSAAIVTRSGVEKRALTQGDFAEVTLQELSPRDASSEWKLHRALYLSRADVNCILHVHSPALTAFAAASRCPNVHLLAEAEMTLGGIALIPYCPPGSGELGETAARYGRAGGILILERHGAVAVGGSVREALHRLERAELLARVEIDCAALRSRVEL